MKLEINIWDEIGTGLNKVSLIKNKLNEKKYSNVIVNINSGGGSVFEGLAIYNTLKNYEAPKKVIIQGLAGSAASIIAMAGDEIEMCQGSFIMIHNASTGIYGGAEELRKQAEILEGINKSIVDIYKSKTGLTEETIKSMMDVESWIDADLAIQLKFATSKQRSDKSVNLKASNEFVYFNNIAFKKECIPEEVFNKIKEDIMEETTIAEESKVDEALIAKEAMDKVLSQFKNELEAEKAKLVEQAKAEERVRIFELREYLDLGCDEIVLNAMNTPNVYAKDIASEILKANKQKIKNEVSVKKEEFYNMAKQDSKDFESVVLNHVQVSHKDVAASILANLYSF